MRRFTHSIISTRLFLCIAVAVLIVATIGSSAQAVDTIELTSGRKYNCKVVGSDKDTITVDLYVGGKSYTRRLQRSHVIAVTINGTRYENNAAKPDTPSTGTPSTGTPSTGTPSTGTPSSGTTPAAGNNRPTDGRVQRTSAEVKALIQRVGQTKPDWYDSVPLRYPQTLDLSWPFPAKGGWNAQRNVGQYIWQIINQNSNRFKEGIRFMHHLLSVNKNNPATMQRIMKELGKMYKHFLGDYERAAFWYQHSGADRDQFAYIHLAECYYKLGNKQMAMDLIAKHPIQFRTIKLLADMGETDRALRIADSAMRRGYADMAAIYAADACRVAGRLDKAMEYYQFIMNMPMRSGRDGKRIQKNQKRARESITALQQIKGLDLNRIADGTYQASSVGYIGPLTVSVTVKNNRITDCKVVNHREDQAFSSITAIPHQVVQKQSVIGIDAVSSATMTSEAILNAAAKALAQGVR